MKVNLIGIKTCNNLYLTSILILLIFLGNLSAQKTEDDLPEKFDASLAIKNIDSLMHNYIYDKSILETKQYSDVQKRIEKLGHTSATKKDFVDGFNQLWYDGPFSHVHLAQAKQSADKVADYLDKMNVEGKGAELVWKDKIAVLTVHTMMGQNTIDKINDAYDEITKQGAEALIIDLRNNGGGAFAVIPLIGHIIDKKYESGYFLSNAWTSKNNDLPTKEYLKTVEPWEGWSIKSFWKDAQEKGVLRIVMKPMQPHYAGPVYVLVSNKTASAAELASDVLLSSERATFIGEKTEGAMLSQKMYDLPQGLQLSLPIADYYSSKNGRIEGKGVKPDIEIEPEKALDKAVEIIKARL